MASPYSSKQNLLADFETAAERSRTYCSIPYMLFQEFVIFVGCFTLFVGAHCLANSVFGNSDRGQTLLSQHEALEVDNAMEQFQRLINDLNITYKSQNELIKRFRIFSDNLKQIQHAQKTNKNAVFGVNRFTLMSNDELRTFLMPPVDFSQFLAKIERINETTNPLPKTRPASLDWRTKGAVTRVKDQGTCGASYAFAATACVESLIAIRGYGLHERSEQQLIDCDYGNSGCHGGSLINTYQYIATKGQTLEKLYPFAEKQGSCKPEVADKFKIKSWTYLPSNEDYLADWVATNGPISIGVTVTKGMLAYKSGIFAPAYEDCSYHSLYFYALAIVGYGTENGTDYWILKPSWGTKFGDNGYIKMIRGYNSCDIGIMVLAPVL